MNIHELPPGRQDISSQIPAEWHFPERGIYGLEIVQKDLDSRLLGISAIANANSQVNADYIFDSNGEPLEFSRWSFDKTGENCMEQYNVVLMAGGFKTLYGLESLVDKESSPKVVRGFSVVFGSGHGSELGDVMYEPIIWRDSGRIMDLKIFNMWTQFHPGDRNADAPAIALKPVGSETFISGNLEPEVFPGFRVSERDQNKTTVERETNGDKYEFSWVVSDGELIVMEAELPKPRAIKIMRAKINFDLWPALDNMHPKRLYTKDSEGFYEIPWRKLYNCVPVSLGYLQAPQQNDENL